jgi:hypothetical protein
MCPGYATRAETANIAIGGDITDVAKLFTPSPLLVK